MIDLKDTILAACKGYERDAIINALNNIIEDSAQQHDRFKMNPCPVCGNKKVYIADIMDDIDVSGKVGMCAECKFQGPKVYRVDMPNPYTISSWCTVAVKLWNSINRHNLFSVTDDLYGSNYQFTLFYEETVELIEALFRVNLAETRFKRGDRGILYSNVVSEMADVIICMFQWVYSSGKNAVDIDKALKRKLSYLCLNESVRTAIAELSKKVIEEAIPISVRSADDHFQNTR